MRLTHVAATAIAAALSVPLAPLSAEAEAYPCEGFDESTTEVSATTDPSGPYALLGVDRAARLLAERGQEPGEGWNVAIVDSGVSAPDAGLASLSVVGQQSFGASGEIVFQHGTNVAGLVAAGERTDGGPTGIAPAAGIYDLRVYEEANETGFGGVSPDNLVAALDWLSANAEAEDIGVVVIALSMPQDPALEKAVATLSKRDVVIVVGSGNRPTEEGQAGYDDFGDQKPGEDARGQIFPAAYADDVFAVSATAAGVPGEGGGEVRHGSAQQRHRRGSPDLGCRDSGDQRLDVRDLRGGHLVGRGHRGRCGRPAAFGVPERERRPDRGDDSPRARAAARRRSTRPPATGCCSRSRRSPRTWTPTSAAGSRTCRAPTPASRG